VDRVTKSLLDEFVTENSLESLSESEAFEHFCGYLITSEHFSETFSTTDIAVGAGGDCGVDCVAIIVNGSLVTNPEEIQDLEEANGFLDATFVFVQAERSSSFETAKIGQFGFGVLDFFSDSPQLPRNEDIALAGRTANALFERSAKFRGNPRCFMYYTTTGRWTDDQNLVVRRDSVAKDLLDTNLFANVRFECLGANELQSLYRKSKHAVAVQVTFADKTVVPEIPGIEQAYVGVLPVSEFMRLIENDNEEVLTSLFYDNVRHWQEWNPVNSEMRATIKDPEKQVLFPLLNNGVTIVAKRVQATGNRFLLEDYQVVNGCQTSYVLHEERASLSDRVYVPVRLIATADPEIRNSIIMATNRQTAVTEDQLFAMTEFPKKLELYFPTFDGRQKLHYERRSRQYSSIDGVEKVRVIDLRTMVRAFASMFLEQPHRTTRNFKALLKTVGTDIFGPEHRLEPYYVAAYAYYRLEFFFRNQLLPAELKPARYHMLMAFRMLVAGSGALPAMNSNEMSRFCEPLMNALWDDERCKDLFDGAAELVREVADGNLHRDNIRTEPFTDGLKERLQ
jgi:hypothetical protein